MLSDVLCLTCGCVCPEGIAPSVALPRAKDNGGEYCGPFAYTTSAGKAFTGKASVGYTEMKNPDNSKKADMASPSAHKIPTEIATAQIMV